MSEGYLGFIGLGAMGGPMCRRLLDKGYSIAVYDIHQPALAELVELGAQASSSPADVGACSDIVLTSLPNADIVEQVLLGPKGLASGMRPGSVLIELSSSRPSTTRRIAEVLAAKGVGCLDAPVSRGVPAARQGTLSIMVGGDPDVLKRCRPVLEVLGTDILHVGQVSSGHALKALNNLLSATNFVVAVEAMLIGVSLGMNPGSMIEVFNASSGRSNITDERFPRYVLSRTFDSNFKLGLMYKDVQTAIELAHECGVPIFVTDLARQIYALAMASGMADMDNQTILFFMERFLGQTMFDGPFES